MFGCNGGLSWTLWHHWSDHWTERTVVAKKHYQYKTCRGCGKAKKRRI